MTGRQEYDRMKDRQRTLGKYMININYMIALKDQGGRIPRFLYYEVEFSIVFL
jgi:hypothetical protein